MKRRNKTEVAIKEDYALISVYDSGQIVWAKVDLADAERVSKYFWSVRSSCGGKYKDPFCAVLRIGMSRFIIGGSKETSTIRSIDGDKFNNLRNNLLEKQFGQDENNSRNTEIVKKNDLQFLVSVYDHGEIVWATVDAEDVDKVSEHTWSTRSVICRFGNYRYPYCGKLNIAMSHLILSGEPNFNRVNHLDGSGLNNSRSNLSLVAPSKKENK